MAKKDKSKGQRVIYQTLHSLSSDWF